MTQCDRSTTHVHFRGIDFEDVGAVDGHRGEGLVDFDEVDVVLEVEVEFAEELGDGEGGANAHYTRRNAGDGGAAEFGKDGLVHLLGGGTLHEENGGRWERH